MLRRLPRAGFLLGLGLLSACATASGPQPNAALYDAAEVCARKVPWIGVRRGFDGLPEFFFNNERSASASHLHSAQDCYRQALAGLPPPGGAPPTATPAAGQPRPAPPAGSSPPVVSAPPATTAPPATPPGTAPARPGSPEGPIIAIASPLDGARLGAESVSLVGVVATSVGLARVQIEVNGRPLRSGVRDVVVRPPEGAAGERPPPAVVTSLDLSERVPLAEGANRIVVLAADRAGGTTSRAITVTRTVEPGTIWAVVIGISRYRTIHSLGYADRDASAMHDYLVQDLGVPAENVTLLLNEAATLVSVKRALGTDLRRRAGEKDTVIIYYAGHGAPETDATSADGDGLEKYLVPHDADPNDLYTTALPMREIETVFQRLSSERVVFITDACYSGATGGRTFTTAARRAVVSEAFLTRLASARGRVVLTASRGSEVSEERDTLGHGVFTYYLLEGLRGAADADGDGVITVDEAYAYVARKVPAATGQNQHPQKKGEVEGQLVIGRVKR